MTGVQFATALPGAVRTLRFVRVVPVTPAGREADFAGCPLVPVAVPGLDRPSSPALTVTPDGPDLRLILTVHGIDPRTLDRLNPGALPRFRLRRTTAGTGDPLYLPVTDTGELVPEGGAYTVTVPARGLAPFVRYTWQAETCAAPRSPPPTRSGTGDCACGGGPTTARSPRSIPRWGRLGGDLPDFTLTDSGWAGEAFALQLVDPLGRTGPLTQVPPPLLPTTTTLHVEPARAAAGVDGAWLKAPAGRCAACSPRGPPCPT